VERATASRSSRSSAAAYPCVRSLRSTVSGITRAYGSTTSAVPSVEPSSSTSTSYSRGNSAMTLRSFQSSTPTVGASSSAGMQK
jgi:hypothetical protein